MESTMKKILIIVSLWSLTACAAPKASFTQGYVSTLEITPDTEINLTANPLTFVLSDPNVTVTSTWWGVQNFEAPITYTQSGTTVTIKVGQEYWPKKDVSTKHPFSFSFSSNTNQFSIDNLKIGTTSVPITATFSTNPQKVTIPTNVNPKPGYYLLNSAGNHTPLPFSPYVDVTQIQPISSLVEDVNKAGLKGVRLAFITEGGILPGLNWAGSELDFLKDEVRYLQSKGIKVIISLGGATGTFPGATKGDYSTFYNYLEKIITTYPGVGLCFDIEGSNPLLGATEGTTNLMKATADIQKKYNTPLNLTLAVLPTGLPDIGLAVVTTAQKAGLHFDINLMAMDYGGYFDYKGINMKDYAVSAAIATAKQADVNISYIQLTPMIGYNDDIAELFSLENAHQLAEWAEKTNVALSMWSFTRDHPSLPGASKWASPSASGPGVQKENYEFCKTFNRD